ncbi:hypothetical protein WICMUC_005950 [Wickerhamomyces mucosus]|uniref:Alcohol acetyltransferase n=1 Tax=Wickerhamomyces mucosus TaxID=1378264 RepID=A0A9P8T2Q9_9ASCO|nr:hypothetical protein WICMUC_005950 [Wickerhamomyces mucosus]
MTILTTHQQFTSFRNTLGLYTNFIVCGHSNYEASNEELEINLKNLIDQRTLLRSGIKDDKLIQIDVDIKEYYEFSRVPSGDITEILKLLHRIKFNIDGPLWKLIRHGKYWIVALDHTLYDGTTGLSILIELFRLFQGYELIAENPVDIINYEYEEFIRSTFSQKVTTFYKEDLKGRLSKYLGSWINNDELYDGDESRVYSTPRIKDGSDDEGFLRLISVEYETLEKTLKILKNKGIFFVTLVNYILLKTFNELSNCNIKLTIPVNLRKFLNIPQETYGLFVSTINIALSPQSGDLFPLLNQLQTRISLNEQFSSKTLIGLIKHIGNPENFYIVRSKIPRKQTMEVSCLSNLSHPLINDFIFSQPAHPMASYLTTSICSNDKRTNFMMTGVSELDKEFFDRFCDEFHANLLTIIKEFNGEKA